MYLVLMISIVHTHLIMSVTSSATATEQDQPSVSNTTSLVQWSDWTSVFTAGHITEYLSHQEKLLTFDTLHGINDLRQALEPHAQNITFNTHDYLLRYQFDSVFFTGVEKITLMSVNVTNNNTIALHFGVTGNVQVELGMAFNLSQVRQSGCQELEEYYKGKCYLSCTELTHGKYPLRISETTCSSLTCPKRTTRSTFDLLCYPQACPSAVVIGPRIHRYIDNGPYCTADCSDWYGKDYYALGNVCIHGWKIWEIKTRPRLERNKGIPLETYTASPNADVAYCDGFNVNANGVCPIPYYQWCFLEFHKLGFRKAPNECKPLIFTSTIVSQVRDPGLIIHLNIGLIESLNMKTSLMDLAYDTKPWSKETFTPFLKHMTRFNILHVQIQETKWKTLQVKFFGPGWIGAIVDYIMDLIRVSLDHPDAVFGLGNYAREYINQHMFQSLEWFQNKYIHPNMMESIK